LLGLFAGLGEQMTRLFDRTAHGGNSLSYRPDIDGLRGVAVLLVLIFHFDFFNIGKAGFIGVDIFFVISGYLISKIIWSGLDADAFSFRQFYIRRIRRLAPPLFVTLALTVAVGAVVLLPQELNSLAKEGVAALIYLSNVYYWQTLNYFGLQVGGSFFLHTWSLAVEEQFYLFFPILLVLIHRLFPKHRSVSILICAVLSFILNLVMVDLKPEATFYLLPTRAWELLFGSLLAAIEFRLPKSTAFKLAMGIGAVVLLVLALLSYNPTTQFPGWFALLPVLSASMFLLAGSDKDDAFGRVLSFPPLRFVGVISYSLYLVHWPVKVFIPLIVFDNSMFWKVAGFLISFLLATLMYLYVERPSKTLRNARGVVIGYALATTALFALFSGLILTSGWRDRFGSQALTLADASQDIDQRTQQCTLSNALSSSFCRIGKENTRATWLILGDSHAQALAGAFDLWLESKGEAGILAFQHGCAPIYGVGDNDCQSFLKNARTMWNAQDIENVFLVSIWRVGLEGGFRNNEGHFVSSNNAQIYLQKQFGNIVRDIRSDGRKAYLWMPLPPSKKFLPFNLARSKVFGLGWELGRGRTEFIREYQPIYKVFNSASSNLNGVADPSRVMCSSGRCLTLVNGRPVYHDNNHPAFSQKEFFAKILSDQIDRSLK
jgi:peptidoglycan/LPS O-acetylase OafA/YrhL